MATLSVDKVAIGMIVDADVKDRSGRLLLRAGTEVNDKTLKTLRTWGVAEVSVRADSASEAAAADTPIAALDPATLNAIKAQVDELFIHNDINIPTVKALHDVVVDRLASKAQGKRT